MRERLGGLDVLSVDAGVAQFAPVRGLMRTPKSSVYSATQVAVRSFAAATARVGAHLTDAYARQARYVAEDLTTAAPDGLPSGAIGARMVGRDPDVTRLVDRLEARRRRARPPTATS